MSTHVTTHNPVRSDYQAAATATPHAADAADAPRPAGRGWAWAGLGAAIASIGAGVAASRLAAIYDPDLYGDADGVRARLADQVPAMIAFHVLNTVVALLLVAFAFGLHRRLRAAMPRESVLPAVATFGALSTAVVVLLGTALDTEFIFGLSKPESVLPESAAIYNHWIGTVAGCWMFLGITAVALFVASRRGGVPRWQGILGLVLGSLALLVSVAPAQYMAAAVGALWLLVASIGFLVGDRAHRRA